jgi:hypothetical protein
LDVDIVGTGIELVKNTKSILVLTLDTIQILLLGFELNWMLEFGRCNGREEEGSEELLGEGCLEMSGRRSIYAKEESQWPTVEEVREHLDEG